MVPGTGEIWAQMLSMDLERDRVGVGLLSKPGGWCSHEKMPLIRTFDKAMLDLLWEGYRYWISSPLIELLLFLNRLAIECGGTKFDDFWRRAVADGSQLNI